MARLKAQIILEFLAVRWTTFPLA